MMYHRDDTKLCVSHDRIISRNFFMEFGKPSRIRVARHFQGRHCSFYQAMTFVLKVSTKLNLHMFSWL